MYNRYIPEQASYTWVGGENTDARSASHPSHAWGNSSPASFRGEPASSRRPDMDRGTGAFQEPPGARGGTWLGSGNILSALLSGKGGSALSGWKKSLKLENWDTGDLLLLLIILYLLVEGEDLDLVIALGLVLLMGLGEDQKREDT